MTLSITTLSSSVIMKNVIEASVFMLSVIVQNALMLSVVMMITIVRVKAAGANPSGTLHRNPIFG